MTLVHTDCVKSDEHAHKVGAAIETARLYRDLSQSELAEKAEMSTSTLSRYERGMTGVDGYTMVRLAHVLDVPLDLLLEPPTERGEVLLAIAVHDGQRRAAREPS